MAKNRLVRKRVRVRGRVQGVYFRSEARARASALGLSGWVRNRRDGSVELAVEGDSASVEVLVAWCRHGPAGAAVTRMEVGEEPPSGERGFSIVA